MKANCDAGDASQARDASKVGAGVAKRPGDPIFSFPAIFLQKNTTNTTKLTAATSAAPPLFLGKTGEGNVPRPALTLLVLAYTARIVT